MDIKSFLYQKKANRAKIILQITSGIIVIAFFVGIIILNKNHVDIDIEHFIWEKISTSWMIFIDNNYPTNTHKLSNSIESFWLKESSINLNNFLDTQVQVDWSISEISQKYPILTISSLKFPSYKLSISNNKFFYTDKLISFDFSKDIDVYSKQIWWEIIVYYQNEPILYVNTFICSNITEALDCENMKRSYILNLTETFDSVLWYTFYRYKENSRVTFNDNNIWYIFTTNTDNDMLNLSHLINIVDSKFLLINKENYLLSWCSDDIFQMKKITKLEKNIIDDDLIRIDISGVDTNGQNIYCKLNINIFDDRKIINKSVELEK